ncbi:MAG: hypothetical protein PHE24_00145 [Patescibacteria group bacterium]|nr:hypothetical protein [Patescibacteria group bacterium]
MAKRIPIGELFKAFAWADRTATDIIRQGSRHKLRNDYGKILVLRSRLSDILEKCQTEVEISEEEIAIIIPGLIAIGYS